MKDLHEIIPSILNILYDYRQIMYLFQNHSMLLTLSKINMFPHYLRRVIRSLFKSSCGNLSANAYHSSKKPSLHHDTQNIYFFPKSSNPRIWTIQMSYNQLVQIHFFSFQNLLCGLHFDNATLNISKT